MDRIHIRGIQCSAHIGVGNKEREQKQRLEVDLILWLNLQQAALEDNLEGTIDYARAVDEVQRVVELSHFSLIEALAEHICRRLLQMEGLKRVRIQLRKYPADLQGKIQYVAVEMTRKR